MFKLIQNSFLIVMFTLGLAAVANAEVLHNHTEGAVVNATEQITVTDDA